MKNILLFTIATNGYDEIFADWLQTQEEYAQKHAYHYRAITKSPPKGISGANSAWLKIPLILSALNKGHEWVGFIDSDCKIQPHAPPLESVFIPGKSIYMCHDGTGRFNSGVIIVKNEPDAIRFFQQIYRWSDLPGHFLPKEDVNLYENGHVIHFGKTHPSVALLDPRWNNTIGEPIGEYIWHGRGRYSEKPRSQSKTPGIMTAAMKRIAEGSRYFLLRRLVRFYENEYQF